VDKTARGPICGDTIAAEVQNRAAGDNASYRLPPAKSSRQPECLFVAHHLSPVIRSLMLEAQAKFASLNLQGRYQRPVIKPGNDTDGVN